eukprot:RCo041407
MAVAWRWPRGAVVGAALFVLLLLLGPAARRFWRPALVAPAPTTRTALPHGNDTLPFPRRVAPHGPPFPLSSGGEGLASPSLSQTGLGLEVPIQAWGTDVVPSRMGAATDAVVVDLLIRSYLKDMGWLNYTLLSVKNSGAGVLRRVLLVVPRDNETVHTFRGFLSALDGLYGLPRVLLLGGQEVVTAKTMRKARAAKMHLEKFMVKHPGYINQQLDKLHAHLLTDAPYILFIDSDVVLLKPLTVGALFENGLPWRTFCPLPERSDMRIWVMASRRMLRLSQPYTFNCCPFELFPRVLFVQLHQWVLQKRGRPLSELAIRDPYSINDYEAMGLFAYSRMRESFAWTPRCQMFATCEARSWHILRNHQRAFYECFLYRREGFSHCAQLHGKPCSRLT